MLFVQEDHNFDCSTLRKINFTKMSSSSLNGDSKIFTRNINLQPQQQDKKPEGKEKNEQEEDLEIEIKQMINSRMLQCRNSVLASQMQKAFPGVQNPIRRNTLPAVLCEISEGSLLEESKEKKEITFKIPQNSTVSDKIIYEEYVVSNPKDKLFTDEFVRKLAIPIQEKRLYRQVKLQEVRLVQDIPGIYATTGLLMSHTRKSNKVRIHSRQEVVDLTTSFIRFRDYLAYKYEIFQDWFDFMDDTFKIVEGRHGTAILAYFLFLRWLLYMNMIHFLLNILFIVSPHILFNHLDTDADVNYTISNITEDTFRNAEVVPSHHYDELKLFALFHTTANHVDHTTENITVNSTMDVIIDHCKEIYQQQIANNTVVGGFFAPIQNLLHGTGSLEPTILFTGSYHPFNVTPLGHVYNVGFAFLCVIVATFIISCIMIIQYSSIGRQENFLVQNTRSNYYINEIFSCWDYCIKDLKIAGIQHDKIVLELKTSLSEDRSKKEICRRSLETQMKITAIRLLIHAFIIMWLIGSFYLIYCVTLYQMKVLTGPNLNNFGLWIFYIQYLPTSTIAILNCISPTVFDVLVNLEHYSSQWKTNISLIRNVSLYLSSVIVLMCTMQSHIACKPKDLCGVGLNETCHSPRCWETYVGQELYKLTIVDLAVYVAVQCYDSVQYFITSKFDIALTRCWGHPTFFLPTEVLAPIYSQTVQWLSVPYAPLSPFVMIIKLIIIFYIKKVKIMYLCDPAEESYHASKFNCIFSYMLFLSFFFAVIVHSYALENIPPSRGCGPFRYLQSMAEAVPQGFRNSFSFLTSQWFIAFAVVLLGCTAHYYYRVLQAQKKLEKRLKNDIIVESADKQFLMKSISNLSKNKSKKIVDRSKIRR